MIDISLPAEQPSRASAPLARALARHPLAAYFLLAFIGTWLIVLPLALTGGPTGLGLLPVTMPDEVAGHTAVEGVGAGRLGGEQRQARLAARHRRMDVEGVDVEAVRRGITILQP